MKMFMMIGILCLSIYASSTGGMANGDENEANRPKTHRCHPKSTTKPPMVCDKPNEEYDCGSACQTRCIRLDCNCYIQTFVCVPGCFCKDGYARNGNDDCIPRKECSVPRNCSSPEPGYGPAP